MRNADFRFTFTCSSESPLNLRDHCSHLTGLRNVSLNRERTPTQPPDLSANVFGGVGARSKIYHNVGARPRKRQGDRRANAAAPSSDQSQLSLQSLHKLTIPAPDYPIVAAAVGTGFDIQ